MAPEVATRSLAILAAALLIGIGCAHHPVNEPLEAWTRQRPLLAMASGDRSQDVVVMLAFSGGGTRAAALAYGVLEELRDTEVEIRGQRVPLLDEVDLISGVSGGSFTAAYYGLFGDRIFEDFEERFLRRNVQGTLIRSVLFNPINWIRLSSARFSRSDLAAEYYDKNVFDGKTIRDFGDVPGPAVLINATDFVRGARFGIIREKFDPICSDLLTFPVSRAVAASSAVPGLLTPIELKSYAGQCGFESPEWMRTALAERDRSSRRYVQARVAQSYLDSEPGSPVYLVDGGLTDNLGIRGAFEQVVEKGSLKQLLTSAGYGGARGILLIVANAQTEPNLDLEDLSLFQNLALTAGISSGIQIRLFNFESLELVRSSFEYWAAGLSTPDRPFSFHMVEVSFSQVRGDEERRYLNNLPTSFVLDDEAVDRLRETGRRVLRGSPQFQRFLGELGPKRP